MFLLEVLDLGAGGGREGGRERGREGGHERIGEVRKMAVSLSDGHLCKRCLKIVVKTMEIHGRHGEIERGEEDKAIGPGHALLAYLRLDGGTHASAQLSAVQYGGPV